MSKKLKLGLVALLLVLVCVPLVAYMTTESIKVDNTVLTYEYKADDINFTIKDFIQNPDSDIVMDYDKESIKDLGVHEITFKRNVLGGLLHKKAKAQVIVQDTTKPEFIKFRTNIILEVTGRPINLGKYVIATDTGGIPSVSFKSDRTIDTTKEGEYTVTAVALDPSGNSNTREMKVVLLSKEHIHKGMEIAQPISQEDIDHASKNSHTSNEPNQSDEETFKELKKFEEQLKKDNNWADFDASSFYIPTDDLTMTQEEIDYALMHGGENGIISAEDGRELN